MEERVYEVWKEGENGSLEMCIDPELLKRILADGYMVVEATVEMIGTLVSPNCRRVAIPRRWIEGAESPDDWVDSKFHWRPQAA